MKGTGDLVGITTFSLIASLPGGGRHKVEVGERNRDESASLDLFLVIELTCFKLPFGILHSAYRESLFHPLQLGSRGHEVFFIIKAD